MKARTDRELTAWKGLPKLIKERIAKYIFKSAIKSNVAVLLFRCEKKHWSTEKMRELFYEMVALYQMTFFGKSISDNDLIEHFEEKLGVDFDIFDDVVEVTL